MPRIYKPVKPSSNKASRPVKDKKEGSGNK